MELVLANWRPTKRTMLPKQHFASTATTTATANLLLCTWLVIFLLAVTMGTAMAEWHEKCPSGCLCDQEASLVSCGGEDEDEDQVGSSDQRNETIQPKLPLDEVWKAAGLVQRLDLRDAPVERLESAQLNGTSSLRELSLVRCNLSGIGASAFARQDQLERLDLSQNLLAVLTQEMLAGLIQLRSLDVSSNRLTRIVDGALEGLVALDQLNLRDNALTELGPHTFKGLSRLEFLNLDGNNLTVISDSAFQGMAQLAHLILSRNPLSGLQHVDLFAARPAYVDLSTAGLERVPSLMARYVRDLRLSGNNLSRLQRGDFESVLQVRLLVLDESGIESVEEDAFGRLEALEVLSMDGNRLSSVPASLPGTALAALHLEANQISSLRSGDFAGLQRLDQLHLGRNIIDSIEEGTFQKMTSLTRLNLRSNRLTRISRDVFTGLVRLRVLDLSDNPLVFHRAEVDLLHHLNAQVKVLFPSLQMDDDDEDRSSSPSTIRASFLAKQTTGSPRQPITAESRTKSEKKAVHNDEGDDNNGQNNEVVFLALSVLATLTGLCMVMAATFLAASGWMRRSRWARIKKEPNQHKALWKRRRIVANGPAHNGLSMAHQTDVVKLSWVSAEDFDQWSTALMHQGADTEHERLLLAVTPHH